jgi:hypothetical protein
LPDWLSVDAIGHAAAQAAACDGSRYIGHAPETLLTPCFRLERAPERGRRLRSHRTKRGGECRADARYPSAREAVVSARGRARPSSLILPKVAGLRVPASPWYLWRLNLVPRNLSRRAQQGRALEAALGRRGRPSRRSFLR